MSPALPSESTPSATADESLPSSTVASSATRHSSATVPKVTSPNSQRPARLSVGVIGVGRVGAVLGAALTAAGHCVVAGSARSVASRERAEVLLPGVPLTDPMTFASECDLLLICVPDDSLPGLVESLAAEGVMRAGQLVAHPCGRYGVGVLDSITRQGVLPLALHPAMTFTGTSLDLNRLTTCCFGITAPGPLRPIAEALVLEMGSEPQWVEEQARPLYHAALATGANHLVPLVSEAMDLLRKAGVEEPGRLLRPLLAAALDNVLRAGDAAMTGPVARGDAGSVAAHLRELEAVSGTSLAAYVAMARLTADRALAAGLLPPAAAEALLDVLADPGSGRTA